MGRNQREQNFLKINHNRHITSFNVEVVRFVMCSFLFSELSSGVISAWEQFSTIMSKWDSFKGSISIKWHLVSWQRWVLFVAGFFYFSLNFSLFLNFILSTLFMPTPTFFRAISFLLHLIFMSSIRRKNNTILQMFKSYSWLKADRERLD